MVMELRKVQTIAAGEVSYSIVLPKYMCKNLDIRKGDYVKIWMNEDKDKIYIEKDR